MDVKTLRDAYGAERPVYVKLARAVELSLRRAARAAGLYHVEVSSRAKDVQSFVRKAISHGYSDPLTQITDKAGVRVIMAYRQEEPSVEKLISSRFRVLERIDKRQELAEHEVGYMGLHMVVAPRTGQPGTAACEVQVRTRAEDVWARLSHEVLYKSPEMLSGTDRRQVLRLSALLELFDAEAGRAWDNVLDSDDYIAGRAITALQRQLFRLSGRSDGDDLTADVTKAVLLPAFSVDELRRIDTIIDDFVASRRRKLTELYQRYGSDHDQLFLHRPESLLIFHQLDMDPFALARRWVEHYPFAELRALADAWGALVEEPL
jgi:ppGpp synthetase/RelA/SpoT-type nucleotidyltranferase